MIYILFSDTKADCDVNLLHVAEVVKVTTPELFTPRNVTECQNVTKACHSLPEEAEGIKLQNSD